MTASATEYPPLQDFLDRLTGMPGIVGGVICIHTPDRESGQPIYVSGGIKVCPDAHKSCPVCAQALRQEKMLTSFPTAETGEVSAASLRKKSGNDSRRSPKVVANKLADCTVLTLPIALSEFFSRPIEQDVAIATPENGILRLYLSGKGQATAALSAELENLLEQLLRQRLLDSKEHSEHIAQQRIAMASDIHDLVAQSVTWIRIRATLMRKALDNDDSDMSSASCRLGMQEIESSLADLHYSVRDMIAYFRTMNVSYFDFPASVDKTLKKFRRWSQCHFTFRNRVEDFDLNADTQMQAFLIVQEALNNAVKYACADHISVTLSKRGTEFVIRVKDDGIGFTEKSQAGKHFGLKIMQERAQRFCARLSLKSTPGQGTEVVLRIPSTR